MHAAWFCSFLFVDILFVHDLNQRGVCQAANLQRGQQSFAFFNEHLFHVLGVQTIDSKKVFDTWQCMLECIRNSHCFSINIAADGNKDGRFTCDLLPTDKYNSSSSFELSRFYHHFSLTSPCEEGPCKHGRTCRALYETDEYKCEPQEGTQTTPDTSASLLPSSAIQMMSPVYSTPDSTQTTPVTSASLPPISQLMSPVYSTPESTQTTPVTSASFPPISPIQLMLPVYSTPESTQTTPDTSAFPPPSSSLQRMSSVYSTPEGTQATPDTSAFLPASSQTQPTSTVHTTPVAPCSAFDGWHHFSGSYYKFLAPRVSKQAAQTQCESSGSHLVSIHSASEQDFLISTVIPQAEKVWVGLERDSVTGSFKCWDDGFPVEFTDWSSKDTPSSSDSGQNCVVLRASTKDPSDYVWNDVLCTHLKAFVCEKAA